MSRFIYNTRAWARVRTSMCPSMWMASRAQARITPSPADVGSSGGRLRLKCDGTRAETSFRLSAKRTSPFKSAGASVQSTTGSRVLRISGSSAGYTMFRGSVKSTGFPLHSSVSPSLPLYASPCAIAFQLDSTSNRERKIEPSCDNSSQ
jgi:hypothetical protein